MIEPADWSPVGGVELEPNALQAVFDVEASVALTAGPGAGKTELLAQRADFLLRTGVCRYPYRILAISFKVDASRNLKERVYERCGPSLGARLDSHTFHGFGKRLIDKFRVALTGEDELNPDYSVGDARVLREQITFSDMVPLANQILRDSTLARLAVQKTYTHVFLDEFQDCTNVQYEMVRLCFLGTETRVTAVGDTKQRIMGWAGALDGIVETFADDFGAHRLNLYQNFRSQPRLLRVQNEIVKVMDPAAASPDEALEGDEGVAEVLAFDSELDEARGVTELILKLIGDHGVRPSEIAVLVSKQPDLYASPLVAELQGAGVPYREEQQLQDLSAEPIAQLIVNFASVIGLERRPESLRSLLRDVTDPTLVDEDSLIVHSRWRRFILRHRQIVRAFGPEVWVASLLPLAVASLLDEMSPARAAMLSPDYEQGDRMAELIRDTCDAMQLLMAELGDLEGVLGRFSVDEAVRIMTVHKSKGLEFDSVIVLGVENETFWGARDTERAAFFVAVSRAKHRLYLTVSGTRHKPDGATWQWKTNRTPLDEFLAYAANVT